MNLLPTTKLAGIRYFDDGPNTGDAAASPFVLIHGLGSSLDFWNAVGPGLADRARTVAFDVPGFGGSDSPEGKYTLAAVTEKAQKFLEMLAIRDATVVGHSLGGIVALSIAAERTDLVNRVVLIDSTLLAVERVLTRPGMILHSPRLAWAVAIQFIGGLIPMNPTRARFVADHDRLRALAFSPYIHDPSRLDPISLADAISRVGGRSALNVLRVIPAAKDVGLRNLMRRLSQPVEMVWGEEDPLITESDIRQARSLMPIARELAIPACGHWPILEKPSVVIDFLLRHGQDGS